MVPHRLKSNRTKKISIIGLSEKVAKKTKKKTIFSLYLGIFGRLSVDFTLTSIIYKNRKPQENYKIEPGRALFLYE